MDDLRERLEKTIDSIHVIDVHSHLDILSPAAENLSDIILYHHAYTELISSGMDPYIISNHGLPLECIKSTIESKERVRNAIPYLKNIYNTTLGYLIRIILRDLYNIQNGIVDEDNWEEVYEKVLEDAGKEDRMEYILREKCNIVKSITVENTNSGKTDKQFEFIEEFGDIDIFMLCKYNVEPKCSLEEIEKKFNRNIDEAIDFKESIIGRLNDGFCKGIKTVMMWLPDWLKFVDCSDSMMTGVIRQLKNGSDELKNKNLFASYSLKCVLDYILENKTINLVQIFCGATVLPNHRSISKYDPDMLYELCLLFNKYNRIDFSLSLANENYIQEYAIIAKHFPNVYVSGYWWHILYPYYINKALSTIMDIVPMNKILGFFSDAYHCEWCYPKLKVVKKCIIDILENKIKNEIYTEKFAIEMANNILYENPRRVFNL